MTVAPAIAPKHGGLYEASRPEHLGAYPLDPAPGQARWGAAHGQAIDSYEFEPILHLAANGHLANDEINAIRERGAEARDRVGTDREQRGTTHTTSRYGRPDPYGRGLRVVARA